MGELVLGIVGIWVVWMVMIRCWSRCRQCELQNRIAKANEKFNGRYLERAKIYDENTKRILSWWEENWREVLIWFTWFIVCDAVIITIYCIISQNCNRRGPIVILPQQDRGISEV